ncbi:hypothetical protein GCM10023116_29460 [Kistimonas scapharcae]|uniref:Uncharacterized protein n=1 Tax=Kistimonas scapharcae TaxID=1036133 RepID=A0ABP8V5D7_9GAMM
MSECVDPKPFKPAVSMQNVTIKAESIQSKAIKYACFTLFGFSLSLFTYVWAPEIWGRLASAVFTLIA